MSKISTWSSKTLMMLSASLLIAVFATIGMSFTPVEEVVEEEEIVEENDSTTTTRSVRRAHWDNSSTNSCTGAVTHKYNSSADYAKTVVQTTGNGSVTISTTETANVTDPASGTPRTATSGTASGNNASISWNCGLSESDKSSATYTDAQITAAHQKTFSISATPKNDDYYFAGWGTSTAESSIFTQDNPYSVTSDMKITNYTSGKSGSPSYTDSNKPYTETYYAFFKERVPANITLKLPTNGTITYSYESVTSQKLTADKTITTKYDLTLVATPDDGYKFFGWYTLSGSKENYISTSVTYSRAYPNDITIYAKFIPDSWAIFNIKGTEQYYYDLDLACSDAQSSSSKIVYPTVDGVVGIVGTGNYTIPSGVTLLVPYDATITKQTKPNDIAYNSSGWTKELSVYRKLVLSEGVNITVANKGVICIGGQIVSYNGGNPSAYPVGACGVIDMSEGGHIELQSGSILYAWGFIKGQDMDQGNNTMGVGTITANSGSVIWEDFAVGDWRGGTACSTIAGKASSWRFFPFQSYTIQNVEVPTTYKYGSTLSNYTNVYGGGGKNAGTFSLIGKSETLFLLKDAASYVRKWYDPTTDLINYELGGTAQLDALNVDAGITTVSSSSYNLPISSNMQISLASGCDMTLSKPMVVQPGAVIEIKEGASLTCSSNIYLFDRDNWGQYCNGRYYYTMNILTSHKNRGDGKSMTYVTGDGKTKYYLDDAKLIVDGILNITGKIYATTAGADIMGNGVGNGDEGKVTFSSLGSSGNLVMCTGVSTNENVAINQANLHNEDDSYTKAVASTTLGNKNGRWFALAKSSQNVSELEQSDHTYNFTYISSGAVSGTGGTNTTTPAVYGQDKTGLVAGMKWCNVKKDDACTNIFNATQKLHDTEASDISYVYQDDEWLQLLKTETTGIYGGSDNNLYAVDGCAVSSIGSVDENCLYTIDGVKKALVDGKFVALEKNTDDEAWHNTANAEEYYISFAGCTWHSAEKYPNEKKAYIVEGENYIWYDDDWKVVERDEPFFFDYNEQNVAVYYEYENNKWGLAQPRVRVTSGSEVRDLFFLPPAFDIVKTKKTATITILKDISGITTPMSYAAGSSTCTLDLNGHTVTGSVLKLLDINATSSAFTITDNSTSKGGILQNIFSTNAAIYCVTVTAGTLNVTDGVTVYVENPMQYASKANTALGVDAAATAVQARAIHLAANSTANILGGTIKAKATRQAYALFEASSAANNTTLNIKGGEIISEAASVSYAVYAYGKVNVSGGKITGKVNTDMVDAYYAATAANNTYNADARGIFMQVSSNKTATSCYYGTLNMTGGEVYAINERVLNRDQRAYGVLFNAGAADVGTATGATDGTGGQKTAAIGSITGGKITVQNSSNYGVGVYVLGHYNSYNKTNSVVKIQNVTIDVTSYAYAIGVWSNAGINGTNGGCYSGDVELTNCNVSAVTTGAARAWTLYCASAYATIYKDNNTTTAPIYYGEYAVGAKMTVNGGTYRAKSKTSYGYTVMVGSLADTPIRSKTLFTPDTKDVATRKLGGNKEAYATMIINDGLFCDTTTTTNCYCICTGGNTTINGGTFNAYATTSTARGAYVTSGTLKMKNATLNVSATETAYGVYTDAAIADIYGFVYNGESEITDTKIKVETRTKATAVGAYAHAATRTLSSYSFNAMTAANQTSYAGVYQYGEYAAAAKMTLKNVIDSVKTKTSTAYAVQSATRAKTVYDRDYNLGGNAEAYPELTIEGGNYYAETTTTTARAVSSGGNTTINGGTFTCVAGSYYAYGMYALAGKMTISNATINATAKTRVSSSDNNAYAYGVLADCGIPAGNTDQTGFIYASEVELNSCTVNATATTYANARGLMVNAAGKLYNFAQFKADSLSNKWATATYNARYNIFPCTVQGKDSIGVVVAAKATANNCNFTVTTKTTSAYGAFANRGIVYSYTKPNKITHEAQSEMNLNNCTFNVTTQGTTTAEGVRSYGTTNISGGEFTVMPKTTTAYGVRVYTGKTTISDNPTFTVTATNTAYGVLVGGNEQPVDKTGQTYGGEVEINSGTFNVTTTSAATIAGVYVYGNSRKITSTSSGYYAGNYAHAGKATINDGEFIVTAKTNPAYGVQVDAAVNQTGATGYPAATATPQAFINGGKFLVTATSSKNYAVSSTPLAANCQITGGYYNTNTTQTSGTTLAKYAVSPKKEITLRKEHELYPDGYRYTVGEGGTVTWKNGTTTLLTEMYLKGETPTYSGDEPTQADTEDYIYTFKGWTPTIAVMDNSDVTYTAQFTATAIPYLTLAAPTAHGCDATGAFKADGTTLMDEVYLLENGTAYCYTRYNDTKYRQISTVALATEAIGTIEGKTVYLTGSSTGVQAAMLTAANGTNVYQDNLSVATTSGSALVVTGAGNTLHTRGSNTLAGVTLNQNAALTVDALWADEAMQADATLTLSNATTMNTGAVLTINGSQLTLPSFANTVGTLVVNGGTIASGNNPLVCPAITKVNGGTFRQPLQATSITNQNDEVLMPAMVTMAAANTDYTNYNATIATLDGDPLDESSITVVGGMGDGSEYQYGMANVWSDAAAQCRFYFPVEDGQPVGAVVRNFHVKDGQTLSSFAPFVPYNLTVDKGGQVTVADDFRVLGKTAYRTKQAYEGVYSAIALPFTANEFFVTDSEDPYFRIYSYVEPKDNADAVTRAAINNQAYFYLYFLDDTGDEAVESQRTEGYGNAFRANYHTHKDGSTMVQGKTYIWKFPSVGGDYWKQNYVTLRGAKGQTVRGAASYVEERLARPSANLNFVMDGNCTFARQTDLLSGEYYLIPEGSSDFVATTPTALEPMQGYVLGNVATMLRVRRLSSSASTDESIEDENMGITTPIGDAEVEHLTAFGSLNVLYITPIRGGEVEIFSADGKLLRRLASPAFYTTFSLTVPAGVYLVRQGIEIQKVVVQ